MMPDAARLPSTAFDSSLHLQIIEEAIADADITLIDLGGEVESCYFSFVDGIQHRYALLQSCLLSLPWSRTFIDLYRFIFLIF